MESLRDLAADTSAAFTSVFTTKSDNCSRLTGVGSGQDHTQEGHTGTTRNSYILEFYIHSLEFVCLKILCFMTLFLPDVYLYSI